MANRTVKDAQSIHGTNPQYLVEKIIRTRIYDSKYWKEECFALSAELLVDKAMQLRSVGGVFGGNVKPTPFLCLILKMLQIQPEKDIIIEFIKQDDFKYVRALGATYLRLVHSSLDCYKYLEPLLNDYRKIRFMTRAGTYELMHMDELIDNLLREERYCEVILPRIQKRWVHETNTELDARVSLLDDDLDDLDSDSEDDDAPPSPPPERTSRNRPDESRGGVRDDKYRHGSPRNRDRARGEHKEKRHRSRSRDRNDRPVIERDRKRRRSRSRERHLNRMPENHHPREMDHNNVHDYRHRPDWHDMRNRDEREYYGRPERDYRNEREIRDHYGREERHHREEREHHREEREHHGRETVREDKERKEHKSKRDRGDKDRNKDKHKRDKRGKDNMSKEEREIAEANQLRAQLGLPPIR